MGGYVNSNLITGEHVVYETKLHWITFVSLKGILTLFIAPLIAYWTSEFCHHQQAHYDQDRIYFPQHIRNESFQN